MRISEDDWAELEAGDLDHGVVTKRLLPRSGQDLYLAVQRPTNQRMLLLRIPASVAEAFVRQHGELPQTQGIQLAFTPMVSGHRNLQMALTTPERAEVFNPLIADVADAAGAATDPAAALNAGIQRFERWRHLLQSIAETGLSAEARRGLFGELVVLRDHLLPQLPDTQAVLSWTGPHKANQDFQLPAIAIEVKTGSGMQPGSLVIANERQLDATGMGRLVLIYLAVDERRGGTGESLNTMVDSLRSSLSPGPCSAFDDLLVRVGILTADRALYEEPRYTVRTTSFWHVTGDFPRIVETDLRLGVSQCRYRISTAGLDQYVMAAENLPGMLKGHQ
ncbi:PD-(D/E)XK motif protein [Winogradskya humida]|uniref:PD-(D/E)XK family protein DUF4420 n=1 Tax=Winogradskya humida TaxID=113566 RepID=A0ABQ3ZU58_9ACTN|nr:PD-(D/E)XK motif protein [Actinoplanes humidus]GIE22150.1 hypothetical protein Ahu01nite_052520 [Actinoplanes humidus]